MNFPGHPALPLDYREIFERSIVGVAVARLDGTFVSANLAFARIFGYDSPAHSPPRCRTSSPCMPTRTRAARCWRCSSARA